MSPPLDPDWEAIDVLSSATREPRGAKVTLLVDGREIQGRDDVTVAVAMLNAGIHRFRDSPTGAPRGPLCAMGTCYECRVTVDGRPGVRSCLEPCRDGMEVETGG